MKKLTFILIFGLLINISAKASDVHAYCATAIGATTSFAMKTENNVINFEITNHNGGGYAPFWSSLVVPNDLTLLAKKAEIIKKLDTGFKTTWNPENCKWAGAQKFSCIGSTNKLNVNGIDIEPWAIYSSVVKDSSFAGDYEYIDMTVSFIIKDETFNYTMRYQSDECLLSETPIEKSNLNKLKIK